MQPMHVCTYTHKYDSNQYLYSRSLPQWEDEDEQPRGEQTLILPDLWHMTQIDCWDELGNKSS